ncbi:alpha/beta fold hydrolase [Streptomyces sp. NBC_01335]|uniref:thioesterase II family protein n=1 Tax=Streptomyces sp. NBC_01335 TaxID=2903828 RepID=UPI002E0FC483|nr:alpha/beta fold hydrolase [Streptomyces sp. NBC_01335]
MTPEPRPSAGSRPSPPPRERWFRRYAGHAPTVRLVCFPHAGGTASLYHGWRAHLPDHVELLAVQYPGRQERLGEPCVGTMEEMTERVLEALTPHLDLPFVLFGHSMGAAVAHEVTRLLERDGPATPLHLYVSGRGPQHEAQRDNVPHLSEAEILRSVGELSGPGFAAYDDPELRPLLLPPLLADYRLLNRHHVAGPALMRTPVTACGGDRDPVCSPGDLREWRHCAENWSGVRMFPGDHFYLGQSERELVRIVAEDIDRAGGRNA